MVTAMLNVGSDRECIQLSLPLNAAYVSAARLTASSVANRMGFDTDEIEDIKAAVSEACTYIIKKLPPLPKSNFLIQFYMQQNVLAIHLETDGVLSLTADTEEMSFVMIQALMDHLDISVVSEKTAIDMTKNHKANLFV
jgi:serine/threonine-protein kinase RsbW